MYTIEKQQMNTLVSIVIPVYNASKYLGNTLDSVCGQSYPDLEILCVNDGSTDDSLSILESYAARDSRIKIFTKPNEGKGAASARNLGLFHATGTYVMFLDSDDFFETSMIEEMVAQAEESALDLVVCSADRFDDKLGRVTGEYKHIELKDAPDEPFFSWKDCAEHIFQICDLIAWNKLYRRSMLIDNDLKFEPIPISDDQFIPALSMIYAKRIGVIDKPFIHYRFNTGSSQVDSQPKHPEAAYSATFSIVERLRSLGVYGQVKKSYLNMAIRLMREYFDKMTSVDTLRFLYDKYTTEVFPGLDAEGLDKGFFYDLRIGDWYELITTHSLEEVLFITCRSYGAAWTTAILRFQVPYDRFPKGGKVVLVGKGLIGRYWYAQLLLSDYCEVVVWVDNEESIPDGLEYDEVVRAEY